MYAEVGSEDDQAIHEECYQQCDILLVHHYLHHQREHCEEQILRQLKTEQDLEIQSELEVVITPDHLHDHPDQHHDRHECGKHQGEPQELTDKESPFRHRRRINVFTETDIPFPPNQLTGKEHDE